MHAPIYCSADIEDTHAVQKSSHLNSNSLNMDLKRNMHGKKKNSPPLWGKKKGGLGIVQKPIISKEA